MQTRQSRSLGSYSSWATNDKSGRSRTHGRRGMSTTSSALQEDDNMLFIGGPLPSSLSRKSSAFPRSPDSQGSDSTPFEDILNRCKNKLEQLSVPDDELERSSLPGKFMSFASSGSESRVIDLVDHHPSDDRSRKSGLTTRSANY